MRSRALRALSPSVAGDVDRAVFVDIDLGAGFFLDAADHLAAWANHRADLFDRDVDHGDARRVRFQLGARRQADLANILSRMLRRATRACSSAWDMICGSDALDLDVHLQGGDALVGAGDFEVHIAQVIFGAQDIGQHGHSRRLL